MTKVIYAIDAAVDVGGNAHAQIIGLEEITMPDRMKLKGTK